MNTHLVLKKLPGPNGELKPGVEVDASEWRNMALLVEQRYLKPLDGVEAPTELVNGKAGSLTEQVTAVVLADLASNGPIAQALAVRGIATEGKQVKQRRSHVEQV